MHSGLQKHTFVKVANKFEVLCISRKANFAVYLGRYLVCKQCCSFNCSTHRMFFK